MENELILHKLNRIEKHIFGLKEILNTEELSDYTGFKKSYIYKLVHTFQDKEGKIYTWNTPFNFDTEKYPDFFKVKGSVKRMVGEVTDIERLRDWEV